MKRVIIAFFCVVAARPLLAQTPAGWFYIGDAKEQSNRSFETLFYAPRTSPLDVRVVTRVTESGLNLTNLFERRRSKHVCIQRRAIRQKLGAVGVHRAKQPPPEEISREFQAVE